MKYSNVYHPAIHYGYFQAFSPAHGEMVRTYLTKKQYLKIIKSRHLNGYETYDIVTPKSYPKGVHE